MPQSPFSQYHTDQNAQMTDFAGWQTPQTYTTVDQEHNQVRNSAGIFDISYLTRLKFTGRHARRFLERMCTRRVSDMKDNTCRYTLICNNKGGIKDDAMVYRFQDHWLLTSNPQNRQKLLAHIDEIKGDLAVKIEDQTEKTGMVSVQGPAAMDFITNFSKEIPSLPRFAVTVKNLLIIKLFVSRTGYTGENGIEIILPANAVSMALKLLFKQDPSGDQAVKPCGLAARNTLRIEAGLPQYGCELTEDIDPFSAGLGFAVCLNKDKDSNFGPPEPFIGTDALKQIATTTTAQTLVGLKVIPGSSITPAPISGGGSNPPEKGTTINVDDKQVGRITSSCISPTLNCTIAMAYIDTTCATSGTTVMLDTTDSPAQATIVELPFYKRK